MTTRDTPRTADADDLRLAARATTDHLLAVRLEASADLRPLEDAVLDAADRWVRSRKVVGPPVSEHYRQLEVAVRALKDAKENG